MSSPGLPLSPIVNVTVTVSPALGVPPPLNQGLIIGNSAVIPNATRVAGPFQSAAALLTYGFTTSDPEYIAAQLYFSQSPPPQNLYVGLQDTTALTGGAVDAAGSGYVVGDTGTIAGGLSGHLATYKVLTLSGSGVATFAITFGGTGYTAAVGAATTATSGVGAGLTVTTTGDVGETGVIAVTACRAASSQWYACMVCGSATADHEAIALFVESEDATQPTFYFANTSDAAVLNLTTGNVASVLKAAGYSRTALSYSTTQGGTAPNNIYAAAAIMGVEMGLNTGLPGFYFNMMFKQLVGIISEPLTAAQVGSQSLGTGILGLNCNLYVGYVNQFTIYQTGITPSGVWIDQTLNRDILRLNIQFNVMNLLVGSLSVPQTDPGETQLIHAVNEACQGGVNSGYLAPGNYLGVVPVIDLQPGDPMPAGYISQAYPFSQQSPADKQARKAMPIITVVNEAGAVQSVVIGVYVNP
jgi:hypothetical protein